MPDNSFLSKVFNKNNLIGAGQVGLGLAGGNSNMVSRGIQRFMPGPGTPPVAGNPGDTSSRVVGQELAPPTPMSAPPSALGNMTSPTLLGPKGGRSQMIDMGPGPTQPGFKMPSSSIYGRRPDDMEMGIM